MNDTFKFLIAGGDHRSKVLYDSIKADGRDVSLCYYEDQIIHNKHDYNIIIGPIPCTDNEGYLNTPMYHDKIGVSDFALSLTEKSVFIAGRISEAIHNIFDCAGITCIDILDREEMSVLNAIPTAEGALQIAMEEMPVTVHGSKVLIMGYGRIGKILSSLLLKMGAEVSVAARSCEDFAWIKTNGFMPVTYKNLKNVISGFDLIYNTVPTIILNYDILRTIKRSTLIIDLASKPGGVDFEKANQLGLKTIWALSLPGKVAPVTAASIIKETIYNVLSERIEKLGI